MSRCDFCKKKSSVPIDCSACKLSLCTRCIDMSIHQCEKLEDYKNEKRALLEQTLFSNKTINSKITQI